MSRKEKHSEVARNQMWREAIHREQQILRKYKSTYSCNLKALSKENITDKPGARKDAQRILSPEEEAEAIKILGQYGHQTEEKDPLEIFVPRTSNLTYGAYHFHHTNQPSKYTLTSCEETRYGMNYFQMAGKSAFSNKQ